MEPLVGADVPEEEEERAVSGLLDRRARLLAAPCPADEEIVDRVRADLDRRSRPDPFEIPSILLRLDDECVREGEGETREKAVDHRPLVRHDVVADEDHLAAARNAEDRADLAQRGREAGMPPLHDRRVGTPVRDPPAGPDPREGIDRVDQPLRREAQRAVSLVELRPAGEEEFGIEAPVVDEEHVVAAGELAGETGVVVGDPTPVGIGGPHEAEPRAPAVVVRISHRPRTRGSRRSSPSAR